MSDPDRPLHVAVGVVLDADDRVLTALRPDHLHQGGLWEFPGGKVEAGETVCEALQREFREELDLHIDIGDCSPLQKILYRYPEKSVLLDVWMVNRITGTATGLEGQILRWQALGELQARRFPPANLPIIKTLQLPRRIAITPPGVSVAEIARRLPRLQAAGVGILQLRQPDLDPRDRSLMAAELAGACREQGIRLMVNGDPAQPVGPVAGLHVNSRHLMALRARPVAPDVLFSAACHNLVELQQAAVQGVDFAILSPVKPTATHPDSPVLGWDGFKTMANAVSLPVYALGGLQDSDLDFARQAGAHGIAAISAYWDC